MAAHLHRVKRAHPSARLREKMGRIRRKPQAMFVKLRTARFKARGAQFDKHRLRLAPNAPHFLAQPRGGVRALYAVQMRCRLDCAAPRCAIAGYGAAQRRGCARAGGGRSAEDAQDARPSTLLRRALGTRALQYPFQRASAPFRTLRFVCENLYDLPIFDTSMPSACEGLLPFLRGSLKDTHNLCLPKPIVFGHC